MVISYNVTDMRAVAGKIKSNAGELQSSANNCWSNYQSALDGTAPALNTCLMSFMDMAKPGLAIVVQNRTAMGTKLDQSASAMEQEDSKIAQAFSHLMG